MILSLGKVLALAAHCGAVSVSQLIALPGQLQQESGYDTTAINDNTLGVSFHPASETDALAYVLAHPGDSIDAGLLQINAMNWRRLGLDARSVFNPQANICAGLQVLKESLSAYNTGRVTPRGLAYADRVLTAATEQNSLRGQPGAPPAPGKQPLTPATASGAKATDWNVFPADDQSSQQTVEQSGDYHAQDY